MRSGVQRRIARDNLSLREGAACACAERRARGVEWGTVCHQPRRRTRRVAHRRPVERAAAAVGAAEHPAERMAGADEAGGCLLEPGDDAAARRIEPLNLLQWRPTRRLRTRSLEA